VGTFKQGGAVANVGEHRTEKYFHIVFLASGLKTVTQSITSDWPSIDHVVAQSCTCALKHSAVAGQCPGCDFYETYCSCLRGRQPIALS
jgi:hypothetical protein